MTVGSQVQRDHPCTEIIDSEITRPVELEAMPPGQACAVCFRWCSVLVSSEDLAVGGGRTTRVEHYDELDGKELTLPVEGGPAVLRSEGACRGAIRRMLMTVLPRLMSYDDGGGRHRSRTEEQQWDEFVPAGLVEGIVALAAGGGSYTCHVWMHVKLTRRYDEAKALLLSCDAAEATAGGEAMCPICMEELAADGDGDGATGLPGCCHAFHRGCILEWFHEAPTCPFCRRDMMQYLDPSARAYMADVAEIAAYQRSGGEAPPPRDPVDDAPARRRAQLRAAALGVRTGLVRRWRSRRRGADVIDGALLFEPEPAVFLP